MNCMSKKVMRNKEQLRREREEAAEKAYMESLSGGFGTGNCSLMTR